MTHPLQSSSVLPNVKISLPTFTYENKLFMFYNALLFLVKSTFCINSKFIEIISKS